MDALPANAIASPCRKICAVDAMSSLCIGCGRTLQEIGGWTRLSDAQRADIMAVLPERLRRAACNRVDGRLTAFVHETLTRAVPQG